jgi:PPM family protein phosphatase
MPLNESEKLIIKYHGYTDIGLVRTENQDSYGKFPEENLDLYNNNGQLFIVADGMGGHTGGKEASSTAVDVIKRNFIKNDSDPSTFLKDAIVAANSEIYSKAESSDLYRKMGTTCSTLLLKGDKGIIGHVGDSRVYKIENNNIDQITTDHTKVNEMLKEGILTKEEAEIYPSKSVLSRALGVEKDVKVDILNFDIKKGQSFVLCSDGLAKVSKEEILQVVNNNSIRDACEKLIALANERGGKDNVTVLIITVDSEKTAKKAEIKNQIQEEPKKSRLFAKIFFVVIIIILIVVAYQFRDAIFGTGKSVVADHDSNNSKTVDHKDNNTKKPSDPDEEILAQARRLFKEGKFESALVLYNEILDDQPMHLGAMQGINDIAMVYFNQAEKLREGNHFDEALQLYQKVQEIQPSNSKAINMIKICKNQIQNGNTQADSSNANPETKDEVAVNNNITQTNFIAKDWNFINLRSDQFTIDASGIEFMNGYDSKMTLYKTSLLNAVVSVNAGLFYFNDSSSTGVIVGFNNDSTSNSETYYLFSFNKSGDFTLKKISGGSSRQLLFIHSEANKNSDNRFLKIECSDNIIRIYNERGLLSSWVSPNKITGRIGLYAGINTSVKFTNLSISGTKLN